MKNTCFLAPIHRKGFSYGIDYVRTYNEYYTDDHLYLVFSNEEESRDFRNQVGSLTRYRSIVCTEKLTYSKPISQKKLFGVKHVFENSQFENVLVTDVDCLFIKSGDYDYLANERIQRKKIYASKSSNISIVEKVGRDAARKFFSDEDVKILSEKTNNFSHYFWFNDIPVYERRYFKSFLDYINYPSSIGKLEYTTFDFILYAYYLILKQELEIEIISVDGVHPPVQENGSFLEAQKHFKEDYFYKAVDKIKPMWLCSPLNFDHTILKLHVDRNK